jgi:Flp pilus assembly protein TadD
MPETLSLHNCKLNSTEFDAIMRPFVTIPPQQTDGPYSDYPRSLITPMLQVLAEAGMEADSLDVLVLHGGACRNPWARQCLRQAIRSNDLFRETRIEETPDLDSSVARGAAIASYWHRARGREIIRPIATSDVGIMTLGEHPVPLIASGTPLPFPEAQGQTKEYAEFFVPKHRPREMLVPFYCRVGQCCRNVGTVRVDLARHGDLPKGAPIKINLRVDSDKMLHWSYRIGAGESVPAEAIADPWTSGPATASWRNVESHRRRMRETFIATRALPTDMRMSEALLLYRVGNLDAAELAVRAVIEKNNGQVTARAANMLSLICGSRGRTSQELGYARQAAELEADNPFYMGNYGYALADAGQRDEAIARLRRAIELDANLSYVYERLGDLYRAAGDEQRAEAELREALRTAELSTRGEPNSSDVWQDVERIARKLGDYPRAQEAAARIATAETDELCGGDHTCVIAGPDSPV